MAGLSAALGLPYTDAVVIAGSLVLGITSGVLGAFAVLRRRSLVGDAVAHATLPGVCVAFLVAGAKDVPGLLVGAALAGLVAALLMVGIERASRIRPDAAIGVVLSGFFAIGVVLLTHLSNSADADQAGLENYLFGQAAGLLERDIAVMAALAAAALVVVAVLRRALIAKRRSPGHHRLGHERIPPTLRFDHGEVSCGQRSGGGIAQRAGGRPNLPIWRSRRSYVRQGSNRGKTGHAATDGRQWDSSHEAPHNLAGPRRKGCVARH